MSCIMPSLYLAKFKVTVSAAMLRCDHTLYEQGWTKGDALDRLVLLPEIWTCTVAERNIPSKCGKIGIKIKDNGEKEK